MAMCLANNALAGKHRKFRRAVAKDSIPLLQPPLIHAKYHHYSKILLND